VKLFLSDFRILRGTWQRDGEVVSFNWGGVHEDGMQHLWLAALPDRRHLEYNVTFPYLTVLVVKEREL